MINLTRVHVFAQSRFHGASVAHVRDVYSTRDVAGILFLFIHKTFAWLGHCLALLKRLINCELFICGKKLNY